jgi:hypothetical protein
MSNLNKGLSLEHHDDSWKSALARRISEGVLTVNDLRNGVVAEVANEVGIGRLLVLVIDTGQTLDLTGASALVETLAVGLLAPLEGSSDVNEEEVASSLTDNSLLEGLARALVRCCWGGNDGGTGLCEL